MQKYNNIFILGANGEIGLEIAKKLKTQNPDSLLYVSYHSDNNLPELKKISEGQVKVDITSQESWDDLEIYLNGLNIKFDYVLSAVGTLAASFKSPEKSLRDISLKQVSDVFCINSTHSVMLAKVFRRILSSSVDSKMVFLSAMVGSIQENDMGGWYSYRASKTALNMFVKNISIEYKRMGLDIKVYSIHPGTTDTRLSNKYLGGIKHTIWSAKESAAHILDTVDEAGYETGSFFNWDGRRIEW